jgi:GTP-binding protein HflX
MKKTTIGIENEPEKAILVGVEYWTPDNQWNIEDSLDELAYLAKTAGAEVEAKLFQKLASPSSLYYIGKGKLQELIELKEKTGCSVIIFNDELSPRQQRNLEDQLKLKIIDRTALILDIFAERARTREGQLQVELAQHQYLLPRLAGQWSHLERLGGGIGTRGPGETQLETDRRIIRNRINHLKKQIESVRRHRMLYRSQRKKSHIPVVALIGYTNAGKSTLLNALTRADVLAEDKLFCTLDPVTRKLVLPDGKQFLITDTVGFIHKLPPSIVASFRATLEELDEADLLLHVVDITSKNASEQFKTVEQILKELNLSDKKLLTVANKVDLLVDSIGELSNITEATNLPAPDSVVVISATKGWNMDKMLVRIREDLFDEALIHID